MPTTTTTANFPPWLEEMMRRVATETNRLYDAGAPQFYPGDTVADFTPDQIAGQNRLRQQLTGYQDPDSVSNTLLRANAANNTYLDPEQVWNLSAVPGYQAVREGIVQDAGRNLAENYMPSVRSAAIANGNFGGSRAQIGEALAAARSTDELTQNLGNLDMNTFQTLLQANQNAINRAPSLAGATLAPAQGLVDLGQTIQNQNQSEITGARERFDYTQNQPWWLLDQLRTSAGGGQSTGSTQRTTGTGPNAWQTIGGLLALGTGVQDFLDWF